MLATELITPHFTAGELRMHLAPVQYHANLRRVANYLEVIRLLLGVPLIKVSAWRSPARNEAVGGSDTSSHLTGLASDFTPKQLLLYPAYSKLAAAKASGLLPPFDQIIYYPVQGHIHIGLGARMRGEVRIRLWEGSGGTPLLSTVSASSLPGAPSGPSEATTPNGKSVDSGATSVIVLFVLALGALLLIFALT